MTRRKALETLHDVARVIVATLLLYCTIAGLVALVLDWYP